MNLTRPIIEGVLDEFVPKDVDTRALPAELVTAAQRLDDPYLHRSLLWAGRLVRALEEFPIALKTQPPRGFHVLGLATATLGFVYGGAELTPPRFARRPAEIPVFGIALNNPSVREEEYVSEVIRSREGLRVDDRWVPILVRRAVIDLHQPPPGLPGGTTAAWARRTRGSPSSGILTAAHVVRGHAAGSMIPLLPSGTGTLRALGPRCIDAAYVEIGALPSGLQLIPLQPFPVPGAQVEFNGAASGKVQAVIAETHVSHLTLDPWFAQCIVLDRTGRPGDSGALVEDQRTRAGVGLYCGALPTGPGQSTGWCQFLRQAADALGLDLLR